MKGVSKEADSSTVVVHNQSGSLGLRIDSATGLLTGLVFRQRGQEVVLPCAMTAALTTEGREVFHPPGSIGYVDTVQLADLTCDDCTPWHRSHGSEETYTFTSRVGPWTLRWEYTFRNHYPRLELNVEVVPQPAHSSSRSILRDLRLEFTANPQNLASWRVEAPGNQLRPGVAADAITEPIAVSPVGGLQGSPGLIALHHPGLARTLVVWPFSRSEIGEIDLRSCDDGLCLTLDTGLAGQVSPMQTLRYGPIQLDALDRTWEQARDDIPAWYATLGLNTPHDRVDWIERANIFEVQIGYSVFRGGSRYAPYPTPDDLLADLGRIQGLGYNVLQIMPRQPYPSYAVHDYADITTSYGQEDKLRAVIDACHFLGMRVILDVLLHGVIDQDVMARTAARVRSGPYADRLDEDTSAAWSRGETARDAMNIAWSRHILDFEPHWLRGSPQRHPLVDEHPEWFMRDSEGDITGLYTKAFDVANPEWQEYFCRAAERLMNQLDIDGFRFDAPTYNALPNWSPATQHRASYSPLGALQLFERIRPRLKRIKDSVLLYTEPSGAAFRQPVDVTYNYDEQWLIPAVLDSAGDLGEDVGHTSVRNGRELAAWFCDRNAVLPPGSLTCHHIDSHDTFWWPPVGHKWRREQYGIPVTRALLAVFALSGGPHMTFVGGEKGIEDDVRRVARLRATLPEMACGLADYESVHADTDAIYPVARRAGAYCAVLLVNLSPQPVETTCAIDIERLRQASVGAASMFSVYDAWNDIALPTRPVSGSPRPRSSYAFTPTALRQLRLTFEAYQPKLLVLRPEFMAGQGATLPSADY